jgi:hypothetical protein
MQQFTQIFDCPACGAEFLFEERRDTHATDCDGNPTGKRVGAPPQLLARVKFNIENPSATPAEKRAFRQSHATEARQARRAEREARKAAREAAQE